MPKSHVLKEEWDRSLAVPDLLRVLEDIEALSDEDLAPIFTAHLADGSMLKGAKTAAEFRTEVEAESDDEITFINAAIGPPAVTTWVDWHPGSFTLRTTGDDEAKVHGVFGPTKRRIDKRFEAIDRGDAAPPGALVPGPEPGVTGVSIGSITGHNVSVSSSGTASSSSTTVVPPDAEPSKKWWQQTWVTLWAPALAAVVAGLVLAFLLGH